METRDTPQPGGSTHLPPLPPQPVPLPAEEADVSGNSAERLEESEALDPELPPEPGHDINP